jgi:cytochrome P450
MATQELELSMPFPRQGVLNIAGLYAKLREQGPVHAVTTPYGDPAWIVVAFDEAKTAFSDKRFGYFVHHDPANASKLTQAALHSFPMGGMDFEEEAVRMRRLLTPSFTPRRLSLLSEWVQQLTDKCLDDMQAAHDENPDAPVNFHAKVGFGLPVKIIGALLGFPQEDADYVIDLSHRMSSIYDGKDAFAAARELQEYMERLMVKKRDDLGEDLISDFIRAEQNDPEFFSVRSPGSYAAGFVFPGHETTVVRMDFGVMYLLSNRQHLDWFLADPEGRIDQVVEEVLRLTSATSHGLLRYALEDIEMGGVTIKRGDLVIISESAANRDPTKYDHAEEFDPTRDISAHLAFGHGSHKCLGMSLAKLELKTVFLSLFRRFPNLRLAQDPAELQIDNSRIGGGVDDVMVAW